MSSADVGLLESPSVTAIAYTIAMPPSVVIGVTLADEGGQRRRRRKSSSAPIDSASYRSFIHVLTISRTVRPLWRSVVIDSVPISEKFKTDFLGNRRAVLTKFHRRVLHNVRLRKFPTGGPPPGGPTYSKSFGTLAISRLPEK
jgi:hypothetical protein